MKILNDMYGLQLGEYQAAQQQAMSQEMIRQRQIAEYAATTQCRYQQSLSDLASLANYRPPVFVPKGWAEWSDYGTTY